MRNLLAPVSNAVALLACDDSPRAAQVRQSIARQVAQMTRLVDDLLDVARGEQGQMTLRRAPVDLREVIAEALDVARPAIVAGGHDLTVESHSSLPAIAHGDRARLVQVVSNLLLNAAKFTPEGGEIKVLLQRGTSWTRTCVRDTGIGIDADALPKIFDIYERAQEEPHARCGLGLGMTIARYFGRGPWRNATRVQRRSR
jgi:signal transduction histidine kinase